MTDRSDHGAIGGWIGRAETARSARQRGARHQHHTTRRAGDRGHRPSGAGRRRPDALASAAHHHRRPRRASRQPRAVPQPRLGPDPQLRARRARAGRAARDRGAQGHAGADPCRAGVVREAQSSRAEPSLIRHRHDPACRRRAAGAHDRHADGACALSQRRAGDERRRRGPDGALRRRQDARAIHGAFAAARHRAADALARRPSHGQERRDDAGQPGGLGQFLRPSRLGDRGHRCGRARPRLLRDGAADPAAAAPRADA